MAGPRRQALIEPVDPAENPDLEAAARGFDDVPSARRARGGAYVVPPPPDESEFDEEPTTPRVQVRARPRRSDDLVEYMDEGPAAILLPDVRKYQKRKEVEIKRADGSIIVEVEYGWDIRRLRRWLKDCPKMAVFIAREDYDPKPPIRVYHHIWYDGYLFPVEKGVGVRVPVPIGQIVENMQDERRTAQSQGLDLFQITSQNDRGAFYDYEGGGEIRPTGSLGGQLPAYE